MSGRVIRCWQCGVEPVETVELRTYDTPTGWTVAVEWPPGDHAHAERPPTPAELVDAGYEALRRITSG